MSDHQEHHDDGHHVNYKKIYFTLLALLAISVAGPLVAELIDVAWMATLLTLITAFGIALYKAKLVIENFMHLKWEKRIMKWVLTTSLLLMALMFAGISPDVMNHEGNNWQNVAAVAAVARGIDSGEEEAVEEDAAPAVELAFNAESMFNIVCATCHGPEGQGDGPAGVALDPRPASFVDPEFWETRDMDRIVQVITNGAASVGGSPLMVAWSASFDEGQIQDFADYVMTFRPNE
ncbi:uncharacterized protein METZ01_LOCUS380909 [marine metagenome]|uniref:Cytochrome c domain-containing protein n=1 Tax=marine metagenome TaxID=408172 RepID=A0A382U2A9_9ZZZZ